MIGWSKPGKEGAARERGTRAKGTRPRSSENPNKYLWKSSHPLADSHIRNVLFYCSNLMIFNEVQNKIRPISLTQDMAFCFYPSVAGSHKDAAISARVVSFRTLLSFL